MRNFSKLIAGAALALLTAAPLQAKEITASIWFPDTHPLARDGYLALAKTLKEKSKGDLTLKVFTGTSLLPPVAHLSGLQDGIVEMTYHAGTYTPSDLPEDNALATLAIGLDDSLVTVMAVADFYLNDPAMQDMFKREGIVFLGAYASPQYQMMCSKKIETPDDLKGAKLRMPSPIHAAWADSVGASAVNVPSSEMYTGLEKGQLDCAINAVNDLKSRSLWDVAKHATLLHLGPYFAGWEYAMSKNAWADVDEKDRRLLLDSISDNTVDMTLAYLASADEALKEAKDHGVEVVEPSEALKKNLDTFVSENAEKMAVETGKKLGAKDPEDLVARFEKTYDKWEGLLKDVDRSDAAALKTLLREQVYSKVDAAAYPED